MNSESIMQRAKALSIRCEYCGATVGNSCFNPRSGAELTHQPAHFRRLQDAGAVR